MSRLISEPSFHFVFLSCPGLVCVPSADNRSKIESFIRSKYESKRWAMDGPPPSDPSVLEGGGGNQAVRFVSNHPIFLLTFASLPPRHPNRLPPLLPLLLRQLLPPAILCSRVPRPPNPHLPQLQPLHPSSTYLQMTRPHRQRHQHRLPWSLLLRPVTSLTNLRLQQQLLALPLLVLPLLQRPAPISSTSISEPQHHPTSRKMPRQTSCPSSPLLHRQRPIHLPLLLLSSTLQLQ